MFQKEFDHYCCSEPEVILGPLQASPDQSFSFGSNGIPQMVLASLESSALSTVLLFVGCTVLIFLVPGALFPGGLVLSLAAERDTV